MRSHLRIAALILVLSCLYFPATWSGELADFYGDTVAYLYAAQAYAPYLPADPIVEDIAANSQFPPGYPALLMLTGCAANLHCAHAVTTLCLMAAFVAFYVWLLTTGMGRGLAVAAVAVLALFPHTFLQSLTLYSDSLYLALSLAFLSALRRATDTGAMSWYALAAVMLAAAMLTRTMGIALYVAMAATLWRHRPGQWTILLALPAVPALLWAAVHQPQYSYTDGLLLQYPVHDARAFMTQLAYQALATGEASLRVVLQTPALKWVVAVLWGAGLVLAIRRLLQWHGDAAYLLAHLLITVLWPFPEQSIRFTWMIAPLLIGYLLLAAQAFAGGRGGGRRWLPAVIVGVFAILTVPTAVLHVQRYRMADLGQVPAAKRLPAWYDPDLRQALTWTQRHFAFLDALQAIEHAVPAGECVLTTKPHLVAFYARRRGVLVPFDRVPDPGFERALRESGCRYIVFLDHGSKIFPTPQYPLERVRSRIVARQVFESEVPGATVTLGKLVTGRES